MALKCVNYVKINGEWVEQKDIPKEEFYRIMSYILISGIKNIVF